MLLSIAGLLIEVNTSIPEDSPFCREFRVDSGVPDFSVTVTREMLDYERSLVPDGSAGWLEANAIHRAITKKLPYYNAFLMHAAVISVDGQAYAFTAPSGTGKSTHISYWKQCFGDRVTVINGDKPILRRGEDGRFYAWGSPWSGKENWHTVGCAPLKAIALFERGTEDSVEPIDFWSAIPVLLGQVLIPDDEQTGALFLNLFGQMAESVSLYRVRGTLSPHAAQVAYEGMHR